MTPTKEQARAAMSRIVDSMSDCTDCVAVIDYIVALEQAVADATAHANDFKGDVAKLEREES